MLTLDDLAAVLHALDLLHVERIILVGDPNQLPPIGAGRPFADLVAYLEDVSDSAPEHTDTSALARLTVEVRTHSGSGPSDALRLASWFTREPQPVDADRVLDQVVNGARLNDLDISFWKTPQDLRERILEKLKTYLGVQHRTDISGFDHALGIGEDGRVLFETPDGVEHFQILSPTRMQPHGVYDLNRWLQRQFRADELRRAHFSGGKSLGQEEIVHKDKVIQLRNEQRQMYDLQGKRAATGYLANGELGIIARGQGDDMDVAYAGRANLAARYKAYSYADGDCPLELAYALTVHKAQGSQFDIVFVVVPEKARSMSLSRELLCSILRSRVRAHGSFSSCRETTRADSTGTACLAHPTPRAATPICSPLRYGRPTRTTLLLSISSTARAMASSCAASRNWSLRTCSKRWIYPINTRMPSRE